VSYVIAIPSHRRPTTILQYALAQLRASDVRAEVHLFLSDERDADEYAASGATNGCTVHVCNETRNATDKFNAIHDAFAAGTRVFVMEDDVRLIAGQRGQNKRSEPRSLEAAITAGFAAAENLLWGVAPHDNAYFFDDQYTRTLKLVVAHAFGFTASGDPALRVTQASKTDYERTLLYWIRDGAVVRAPGLGVRAAASYRLEGGMQSDHTHDARAQAEEASVAYLTRRYAHLCRRKKKASSPFPEIAFKRPMRNVFDWAELQRVLDKANGYR